MGISKTKKRKVAQGGSRAQPQFLVCKEMENKFNFRFVNLNNYKSV